VSTLSRLLSISLPKHARQLILDDRSIGNGIASCWFAHHGSSESLTPNRLPSGSEDLFDRTYHAIKRASASTIFVVDNLPILAHIGMSNRTVVTKQLNGEVTISHHTGADPSLALGS